MANADDFIQAVGTDLDGIVLSVTDNGQLTADSADSSGEQMIGPFEFCVTFLGREAFTLRLMAPSPEAAADTVNDLIRLANRSKPGWAAFVGACPSGV
jgi:hypothetical protein